jgi:acyl-CoA synthetase (AMP-forming)/AMP-acid ligase II
MTRNAPWQDWALPFALRERARSAADRNFVSVIDGDPISYGELHDAAERVASFLASLGSASTSTASDA